MEVLTIYFICYIVECPYKAMLYLLHFGATFVVISALVHFMMVTQFLLQNVRETTSTSWPLRLEVSQRVTTRMDSSSQSVPSKVSVITSVYSQCKCDNFNP